MSGRSFVLVLSLGLALAGVARAQESGGSFGGSSWDEEPSGGGSSSSGSSDWSSGGGSSSGPDYAAQQAEQQRQAEEARAEAERQRLAAEEAERQRIAAERARRLALPPAARIAELTWPPTPAFPAVSSPQVAALESPLRGSIARGTWAAPIAPTITAATHDVVGPMGFMSSALCGVFPTLGLVGLLLLITRPRKPRPAPTPVHTAMRLSIAFDWTARAALQAELASMASRFDMRSRQGLSDASRAIQTLLLQHTGASRYVSWELASGDTRSWFQMRTNDLRARFRAELVRNESTMASPAFTAREHEGQGLVVVSLVVAGKTPIAAPTAAFDVRSLSAAITAALSRPPGQTQALEVVWSPAAENDRMSSYELEKLYPELQRISEGVGAKQCAYCRGPFPLELGKCPACGAPV